MLANCLRDDGTVLIYQQVYSEFQGNEAWWTDYISTLRRDGTQVTDVTAISNLCIKCVNDHGSIVGRPAVGAALPRCADENCDAPLSYTIDSGATLVMCNRSTTAML